MIRKRNNIFITVLLACVFAFNVIGCQEDTRNKVFEIHQITGAVLTEAYEAYHDAYKNNLISESTFNQIDVSWKRARDTFLQSSKIAETIIRSNSEMNISEYYNMMTQVMLISKDIISWVKEDKGGVK